MGNQSYVSVPGSIPQDRKIDLQNLMQTRSVFPWWLVHAFDSVLRDPECCGRQDSTAAEKSMRSRIIPGLSAVELQALSALISNMQSQILAGEDRKIRINFQQHLRDAPSFPKSKKHLFEKVIQGLSGFRLLTSLGNSSDYHSIPIFAGERWYGSLNSDFGLDVEFDLARSGLELILGFVDPYRDLTLLLSEGIGCQVGEREFQPLVVWRSIWMELSAPEQAVYLSLEKAIQWQSNYVSLDGVFSSELGEIFRELSLPKSLKPDISMGGGSYHKWRFLEKLGKKLTEHGWLRRSGLDYVALSEMSRQQLLWNVSSDTFLCPDLEVYKEKVLCCFSKLWSSSALEVCLRKISLIGEKSAQDTVTKLLPKIYLIIGSEAGSHAKINLSPQLPLLTVLLLAEWTLRDLPGFRLPLPVELTQLLRSKGIISQFSVESFSENYHALVDSLNSDSFLPEEISSISSFSLTLPEVRRDPIFRQVLLEGREGSGVKYAGCEISQEVNLPGLDSLRAVKVKGSEDEVAHSNFENDTHFSKLKKLAGEELASMRRNDRASYEALEAKYLNSLPLVRRQVVLEVKMKLNPTAFSDQLKHHLIQFMIDNPSVWVSA